MEEKLRIYDDVLIKVPEGQRFYNANGRICLLFGHQALIKFGKELSFEFKHKRLRYKWLSKALLEKFDISKEPKKEAERIYGCNRFYAIQNWYENNHTKICMHTECQKPAKRKVFYKCGNILYILNVCTSHQSVHGKKSQTYFPFMQKN